jgi:hypothetical protein
MPRGDRTGPNKMGPMTGRGAGYCSGSTVPGYANPYGGLGRGYGFGAGFGRGLGRGFGRGFGYGAGYGRPWGFGYGAAPLAPLTPQAEKELLDRQTELLESELQAIRRRLEDLNKAGEQ